MWFEILKKDLMKQKSVNMILFLFITLSTIFLASSVSNIRVVMNGLKTYMKYANVSDVTVVLGREDEKEAIAKWLESRGEITEYAYEQLCQIKADDIIPVKEGVREESASPIEAAGKSLYLGYTGGVYAKPLDSAGNDLTLNPGEVAVSPELMGRNGLQTGDALQIKISDQTYTYRIAVICKDILFGNEMSGMGRFVFCKEDYDKMVLGSTNITIGMYGFNTTSPENTLDSMNLQGEVKAEKNQYFGKFLWGLNELKDELNISRRRELELQKEKKMLLLSLSHDIKTPLNMIKLYGKALEDGLYATGDEQRKAYCQIGEKAAQIENFVGEIMKASKEDILHIEVVKGEFYLRELVQWIDAFFGEKCALRKCSLTIGDYHNRIFRGDLNRLFEVFENLFVNAFKYGDGRQISISFYEEDYRQLIRVSNTGEPVSEETFVHLFDSFFRGENTRGQQGNGLGLYICREIMHKMGGEIFAECEQDGMAFVVVMPMGE